MGLSVDALASNMLTAAKGPLETEWKTAQPFAETQLKIIAEQIVDIEWRLQRKTITPQEAHLLLDMQKNASRNVLLTVEGIGLVAAEEAINGALGAVAKVVNGALGFSLL